MIALDSSDLSLTPRAGQFSISVYGTLMCGPRVPVRGTATGLFALNVCVELTSTVLFGVNVLFTLSEMCVSFVKGAWRLSCSIFSWRGEVEA
jgi:hypothetical protein